jgi:hypothetical protein
VLYQRQLESPRRKNRRKSKFGPEIEFCGYCERLVHDFAPQDLLTHWIGYTSPPVLRDYLQFCSNHLKASQSILSDRPVSDLKGLFALPLNSLLGEFSDRRAADASYLQFCKSQGYRGLVRNSTKRWVSAVNGEAP